MSNILKIDNKIHSVQIFPVLNLKVHLHDDYCQWLLTRLAEGSSTHVVTLNAEMSMMAQENKALAAAVEQADLVVPDGAGVILYMRMRGLKRARCPGIELAASLLEQLGKTSFAESVCFYGAKPGVAATAAQIWQHRVPSLAIMTQDGYLSDEAEAKWKQTLQMRQPKVILVGLGVPKQEFWIQQNRHLCPNSIWIGVGGSFDIWAGEKSRAPVWLRNNNLEWTYRLYQEPWRWRRMLYLPRFFWRSLPIIR
ncbi:WecB/TagA/CpsF family glycosyltransferase [Myxosarcina sp. GI1]|uniref:WecB/TagA/CpsF family glycosyltransferase n=1 Tax=Myxosarcina sp. GI1 TaxID=1541065 RepID=UPI00068EF616|nr:WecB/TagA/CpsF family glycosyltransferase [Myxosarcina sp. GI1]